MKMVLEDFTTFTKVDPNNHIITTEGDIFRVSCGLKDVIGETEYYQAIVYTGTFPDPFVPVIEAMYGRVIGKLKGGS